jgi:hypothetical protein
MHKKGFGQSYCQDLHTKTLKKFIWHFSEVYPIFYEFWNLEQISENYLNVKE